VLEAKIAIISRVVFHVKIRHPAICIRTNHVHSIFIDYFVLVINAFTMGSTSMNHGDGHIGINNVKD
jgi:hypothetical protein